MLKHSSSYNSNNSILGNPYPQDGRELDPQVVSLLTDPSLYFSALLTILPKEDVKRVDFSSLLQSLARHGVYVMEGEGKAVNHSVLAKSNPFREVNTLYVNGGINHGHLLSIMYISIELLGIEAKNITIPSVVVLKSGYVCPTIFPPYLYVQTSHLALMDGLMTLYTKTTVSVQQVVKTVK